MLSVQDIDDTSNVWVAMGSNKDCEDFATACVSTINALQRYDRFDTIPSNAHPMTPLVVKFIRDTFAEAFITCGWVQVNIQNYNGMASNVENEGHAWCSVKLSDGTFVMIECTTPILPHKHPRSLQNQTLNQYIFGLYGAAFNLTSKHIVAADLGYGPAQLQPRERYKAVAFIYSDITGYAVCNTKNYVGVEAEDFIAGRGLLVSLSTAKEQDKIKKFRELDVNPDFANITDIILTKMDLHARSIKELAFDADKTIVPAMPSYSVRFVPASQLISQGKDIVGELNFTTNGLTPVCIYPAIISPTAQGFYVGLIHGSSVIFSDSAK